MHFQYFLKLICNLCKGKVWGSVPSDGFFFLFINPAFSRTTVMNSDFWRKQWECGWKGEKASDDMCQFVILIFVFESGTDFLFLWRGEKCDFWKWFFPPHHHLRVIEMQSTVLRKTLFDFVCIKCSGQFSRLNFGESCHTRFCLLNHNYTCDTCKLGDNRKWKFWNEKLLDFKMSFVEKITKYENVFGFTHKKIFYTKKKNKKKTAEHWNFPLPR